MPRSAGWKSSRRKMKRNPIGRLAIVLTGCGLGVSLGVLARIGPPPALRIDALWVNEHQQWIRVLLGSLIVALIATGFAVLMRQRLLLLAIFWILAVVIGIRFFSDRIPIIMQVLFDHAR